MLPAQLQMAGKGTAYPRRRSPVLVQFLCMLHRAKSPWLQDVGHGSASQSLRCDSSHKESSEGAMVTWSSWLRFCLNCPRVTWPVPLAMARALVHTRNDFFVCRATRTCESGRQGTTACPRRRSPELVQFLCMLHRAQESSGLQGVGVPINLCLD